MKYTWPLLLVSAWVVLAHEDDTPRPIVSTPLGRIRGTLQKSAKRQYYSSFEGIPYAKPPIGNRRFELAEPVEPWKGIWDAISVTECLQTSLGSTGAANGEEDCLHINVYVPREKINPKDKLDVIVHIHGGLFMYGSGHAYAHPDYFMDENVIFVTFNYRLGIFGFLSTEDNVVPGNNGLKDQVLALQWVQDNIASFGGNPESVTLTGVSAGGSSVHYHYLSDMSHDLFHRGFSQSGVSLNSWALQKEPLAKARLLAEAVGCLTTTTSVLVKCLKQRPALHLLSRLPLLFGYNFLPFAPFGPVVEKSAKPFLKKHPYFLLSQGRIHAKPWLVSTVNEEGLFPAVFLRQDIENVSANWTTLAPFLLDYYHTKPVSQHEITAQTIRSHYFKEKSIEDEESFPSFVQLFTDRFKTNVEDAILLQATNGKAPVYYYDFGYQSDPTAERGVSHGEDGQYFFYNMYNQQPTPNEVKMKDHLIGMLLSFVRTGKPVLDHVIWKPVVPPQINVVKISGIEAEGFKTETVKEIAPTQFWLSLGLAENYNLVKDELNRQ